MNIICCFGSIRLGVLPAALSLLLSCALVVRSTDYYVATNGPGGDYQSWGQAASNIQDAVKAACGSMDNTVWVSNGSYCLTSQIAVTNRITVRSVNGWTNTLVYMDWPAYAARCFYVINTGTVDGFTISNGHRIGSTGAGAYIASAGKMQNCYFVNNTASNNAHNTGLGAGAYIYEGIVSNCIFFSNLFSFGGSAGEWMLGGAVYIRKGSLLDCTFFSNCCVTGTVQGGGIYAESLYGVVVSNCLAAYHVLGEDAGGAGIFTSSGDECEVVDCVFSNNSAGARTQGAIFKNCIFRDNTYRGIHWQTGGEFTNCSVINNSTPYPVKIDSSSSRLAVFDNCIISNNSGVGVYIVGGGIVRNCLICNNRSTITGGGVYLENNALYHQGTSGIINCTIVSNYTSSSGNGGGIYAVGTTNYIVNCIIASNKTAAGAWEDIRNASSGNSNNYYNCCCNATNSGLMAVNQDNITNDPSFVNASAGNWRLSANSPCLNTGTNQNWMTNAYDLDGRQRIRYGTVDMGAYETIYEGTRYGFW